MSTHGLALREAEARFLDHCRAGNYSAHTIRHYTSTFRDIAAWLAATRRPDVIGVFTASNVRAFQVWLEETPLGRAYRGTTTRSVTGVHGRLKDLRAFLFWLAEEELLDRPPKIVLPQLPDNDFPIFSDRDLAAIYSSRMLTARGPQAVRNRALAALLLDTGLRLAEIAGIELTDIDLDFQGTVLVRGKGNKRRSVPFHEKTRSYIREWLKVRDDAPGSLFQLQATGIKEVMARLSRETGISCHPHRWRHTACTLMLRQDMDLHSVRRIMGHSSLSVTEKYLSLTTQDLARKHTSASPQAYVEGLRQEAETQHPKRRRLTLDGGA